MPALHNIHINRNKYINIAENTQIFNNKFLIKGKTLYLYGKRKQHPKIQQVYETARQGSASNAYHNFRHAEDVLGVARQLSALEG